MANATTKTTETTNQTTNAVEPAFHSIGALFATSSEKVPFVGKADASLLEALGLEAPEGKEWKLFVTAKTAKSGKPYNSIYLGLSDIRR